MCNAEQREICCPMTFSLCSKAINWCNSPAKQNNVCFCDGEPDYCCNDCYFCFTPFTLVIDMVCLPCNIYKGCSKKEQANKESNITISAI